MNMKTKREELAKNILKGMLIAGVIAVASTSPYFVPSLMKDFKKYVKYRMRDNKNKNRKFTNTFYYLKNRGLVKIEDRNGQIFISLTEEGKKRAGKYQINDLKIEKTKKWDKNWWVLIFDVKDKHRIKREALRGKIKELGLFQLQKSVWIFPYNFQKEIELLRSFFGLTDEEMKVIVASKIENDSEARSFFGLKTVK